MEDIDLLINGDPFCGGLWWWLPTPRSRFKSIGGWKVLDLVLDGPSPIIQLLERAEITVEQDIPKLRGSVGDQHADSLFFRDSNF